MSICPAFKSQLLRINENFCILSNRLHYNNNMKSARTFNIHTLTTHKFTNYYNTCRQAIFLPFFRKLPKLLCLPHTHTNKFPTKLVFTKNIRSFFVDFFLFECEMLFKKKIRRHSST